MGNPTDKVSVHVRKFYRVVLEEIDGERESEESFAIKLSMRMRTSLPRVRQVLRQLPYMLKSGLSAEQANRLKSILEQLGARARLETHFVTPGRPETAAEWRANAAKTTSTEDTSADPIATSEGDDRPWMGREWDASASARPEVGRSDETEPAVKHTGATPAEPETEGRGTKGDGGLVCPGCGWEEKAGTEFCAFCQEPLAATSKDDPRPSEPKAEQASVRPTGHGQPSSVSAMRRTISENIYLIFAGLLLILLTILIFKQ